MSLFVPIMDELMLLFGAAAFGLVYGWLFRPLIVRWCVALQSLVLWRGDLLENLYALLACAAAVLFPYLAVVWLMDWPWVALIIPIPTIIIGVLAAAPEKPSK